MVFTVHSYPNYPPLPNAPVRADWAERVGVDLWHHTTPNGATLQQAVEFLLPYALGAPWPWSVVGGSWMPDLA